MNSPVVLITGALAGIGRATALAFAHSGARLVVSGRRPAEGAALEAELRELGSDAFFVQADVRHDDEVRNLIDQTVARFGRLDVAVSNAGTEGTPGPVTEASADSYAATFDTNVLGMLLSLKHELRVMTGQRSGSIINISSTYGVVSPDQSVYDYRRLGGHEYYKPVGYSVAKSGMLNFTRWLAEYAAPLGVRVNTLVPGGVQEADHAPEFVAEYEKRTPLGRMARDDDYNGAVLFLASAASAYMTGAMLVVDGGWTAR